MHFVSTLNLKTKIFKTQNGFHCSWAQSRLNFLYATTNSKKLGARSKYDYMAMGKRVQNTGTFIKLYPHVCPHCILYSPNPSGHHIIWGASACGAHWEKNSFTKVSLEFSIEPGTWEMQSIYACWKKANQIKSKDLHNRYHQPALTAYRIYLLRAGRSVPKFSISPWPVKVLTLDLIL